MQIISEAMRRASATIRPTFSASNRAGHRSRRDVPSIAARFGVTPTLVRQRLNLACVSPKFMQIYRDGRMSFDQLMAFRETKVYQYRAIAQGN
jgi:ParB family transcriptional regulator, chromosome partitioning protein